MKKFAGMVHADTAPMIVGAEDVQRVHMFDVPVPLHEHAHHMLPGRAQGVWWTLGEFRYAGEDYGTAVGMWDGREVWYGVERPAMEGVSLAKAGDARTVRPVPSLPATGDVELRSGGGDGDWVTWEPRARVELWRREAVQRGGYEMAALWGMALRGELYG